MVATRRAVRAREARSDAGEAEEAEETSPVRSMREDDEDDGDEGARGDETATESGTPVVSAHDDFGDVDDAWGSIGESPTIAPMSQTPPMRVCARVAAIEEAERRNGEGGDDEEDGFVEGMETPERDVTSERDRDEDECGDSVNLGGTPEGANTDDDEQSQQDAGSQTPLLSPTPCFRHSNVEPRSAMKQEELWLSSPMIAPLAANSNPLGASIDARPATPVQPSTTKRAAMRMSLPANVMPMTPIPISRQILERIECLGPSLNIVQRSMLVVGILLDFYSKTQLIRELIRFARQGLWVWFTMVLMFFIFSASCITGYWVLHYPMPKKPAEIKKDQKVFGFSKYDFKVVVRRVGAVCATLQLGTAFAAWRALRTNDVRARKAEMDLRGMQLVDTIFLTLPMATLQAYIGMACSSPDTVCMGREGFDSLLFFAVAGSITSGTLCFTSLDLHEKPPKYNWSEYWQNHKAHLSEMMTKACYRFFELSARVCTLGLFAAVTGPYVIIVFVLHACIILGLLKLRLPGVHDRKVWEKFCELREFTIFGRKWHLPVLDDIKLLVACLIWPPSCYVSNAADRKGKFWWRSTSCPRKSFWSLMREDALIPFAVVVGVVAIEAGIMLSIIALVANEHFYGYLAIAVGVNFMWLIGAVNWMSVAALWNPFTPEGPALGYPSISAINNAIGGRQLFAGLKKTPTKKTDPESFLRSPGPFYRSPLEPVEENKRSIDLTLKNAETSDTPDLGFKASHGGLSPSSSLGVRTTPVMIKGSPKPVEVYVDMGDDSADMNEEEQMNPMVLAAVGEEQMLRSSANWRDDSMDMDRTMSGDIEVGENLDDLEAAREALDAVAALNVTEEYDGDSPNLMSPAPAVFDKENFNDTPEMLDREEVSPILASASPMSVRNSSGYSPR